MEVIETESWKDFLEKADKKVEGYRDGFNDDLIKEGVVLFRGHADSEWHLNSTLERNSEKEWSLPEYIDLAFACAKQIESFEDTEIDLPSREDFNKKLRTDFGKGLIYDLPLQEYLIFLRHHGFPSPLIDWTTSKYLASYFAFIEETTSEFSSVYAYVESPSGSKSGYSDDENINILGPYLKTHKRHFLQKSRYTYATKYVNQLNKHWFINHEKVLEKDIKDQDLLFKFEIPSTERENVLKELDSKYNINPFSLFQTTDSLVKTLGLKMISLRHP